MTLTDLIALLALFVASYGAILSTYTAINEFFRLKISIFDSSKTCITLTKSGDYLDIEGGYINTYYKNLYTVIIPIRIVNKSKNPTTINEIVLNDTYILNSSSNFDDSIPTAFSRENSYLVACDSRQFDYPILKPLQELKPLDTFEGYLIFNNLNEFPSHFDVKINTVQKSKTFHLQIKITNDYRNERTQE